MEYVSIILDICIPSEHGTLAGRKMEDDTDETKAPKVTRNCRYAAKNTLGYAQRNS
jgi:hypothetical protein